MPTPAIPAASFRVSPACLRRCRTRTPSSFALLTLFTAWLLESRSGTTLPNHTPADAFVPVCNFIPESLKFKRTCPDRYISVLRRCMSIDARIVMPKVRAVNEMNATELRAELVSVLTDGFKGWWQSRCGRKPAYEYKWLSLDVSSLKVQPSCPRASRRSRSISSTMVETWASTTRLLLHSASATDRPNADSRNDSQDRNRCEMVDGKAARRAGLNKTRMLM